MKTITAFLYFSTVFNLLLRLK